MQDLALLQPQQPAITGATGHPGKAPFPPILLSGHDNSEEAKLDAEAEQLRSIGVRGTVKCVQLLQSGGVLHTLLLFVFNPELCVLCLHRLVYTTWFTTCDA